MPKTPTKHKPHPAGNGTAAPATPALKRPSQMPDVQASKDQRQIAIDRVGVKDITYPMKLRSQCGGDQHTVASVNMYVALPHYQKGTHMSRFLEVLNEQTSEPVTPDRIPQISRAICER